jgi:signal transduction histidine kinase
MPSFRGIRTRVLLIAALFAVTTTVTGGSLLIIRSRIHQHVSQELSDDLTHSLATLQSLQQQRREALIHESALLADLSDLKALMTTHDERTIQDGATLFWKDSGSDLFALVDPSGQVLTVYTQGKPPSPALQQELQEAMGLSGEHYLIADGRLFDFSVRPLYFGDKSHGTLLGYVVSGYVIDRNVVNLISRASGNEVTFLAGAEIMASTLPPQLQQQLLGNYQTLASAGGRNQEISLGREQFLGTEADLSAEATHPLRLVVLKSFAQANRVVHDTNRLVLLLGITAVLLGSLLMLVLSGFVTQPLEMLAQGVRAFGFGDHSRVLPSDGTREVRELSAAFARMRNEIINTNRALLESEKLVTIGRMASSVSHDLRHYLAAVYANAEFLSSAHLSEQERREFFADIHIAVHGATELLESLLIFSKTGAVYHRERNSLLRIVERCVALLRAHPEAEGVTIRVECADPSGGYALVDAKQMQRAIYNLLLNACQSAHKAEGTREVLVSIATAEKTITLTITDSGAGVAEHIRNSLFEPFVSDGKHSGTGLGLTLANSVAKEHGGAVTLLSTQPGETIFRLSLCTDFAGAVTNTTSEQPKTSSPTPSSPTAGGILQ